MLGRKTGKGRQKGRQERPRGNKREDKNREGKIAHSRERERKKGKKDKRNTQIYREEVSERRE